MLSTTSYATTAFALYRQAALIQQNHEGKHGRTSQTIKAHEQTQPGKPALHQVSSRHFSQMENKDQLRPHCPCSLCTGKPPTHQSMQKLSDEKTTRSISTRPQKTLLWKNTEAVTVTETSVPSKDIWEYSSTCSEPTQAAEHWRECHCLQVHTLPGHSDIFISPHCWQYTFTSCPYPELQERESTQTRDQRSSLECQ